MAVPVAFTLEQAARVTGISERRIALWDRGSVLSPSLSHGKPQAPYGRIYAFHDLVVLRTLADLRDQFVVPLDDLRQIAKALQGSDTIPWTSLGLTIEETGLYVESPDGRMRISAAESKNLRLPILPIDVDLGAIADEIGRRAENLARRDDSDVGKIVTNRYVMGNRPVLSGTRIPTQAIWEFHDAGCDVDQIIEEYPQLTRIDVERAIAYEAARRQLKQAS